MDIRDFLSHEQHAGMTRQIFITHQLASKPHRKVNNVVCEGSAGMDGDEEALWVWRDLLQPPFDVSDGGSRSSKVEQRQHAVSTASSPLERFHAYSWKH